MDWKKPFIEGGEDPPDELVDVDHSNEQGLLSGIQIPLIVGGRLVGALSVRSRKRNAYGQKELELARRVGIQIAGSVANAELHAITEREASDRATLAEIGRLVGSSLDAQEMFKTVAEPFRSLVPYDRFSVWTFDSRDAMWTVRFVKGDAIEGYETGARFADTTVSGSSTISRVDAAVSTGDEKSPDVPEVISAGLPASLRVPLVVNDEIIGGISVRSREKNTYTRKHAELARRMADQIAGNVANSELHRALADNEARTRAVVETAAVGIVTADAQLTMLSVNDATVDIFGYTREELIGQNVMLLAATPYNDEHDGFLEKYDRTGEASIIGRNREVEGRRKDGTVFPIELEVTQVDLERGRMYTGVIRDITDRKRAEAELADMAASLENRVQERTVQLQTANSELEAFSYSVSHDLRGPMSMNAHLAARLLESEHDTLSDTSKKYIELIARSSTESAELVTDLLNFARLGQQELNVQNVDPLPIVNSIRVEYAEQYPGVRWTLSELPVCQADPGLLRIVLANLLSNACKYTGPKPDPSVEVGATVIKGITTYFVRDNGVGFDIEQEHRVFEVFERLHRPEDYAGTGAGLAIVRRIVERHGGRIWADSEIDKGTTFFFTLTRSEEETEGNDAHASGIRP
jgi:PAS domain S-box-containing protein